MLSITLFIPYTKIDVLRHLQIYHLDYQNERTLTILSFPKEKVPIKFYVRNNKDNDYSIPFTCNSKPIHILSFS